MSGKTKIVCKVIGTILALLLVLGIVGIVLKFTNGGNETFKTFYLVHDGKEILAEETATAFKRGETYRYDVKYTFDFGDTEPRDYSVKVSSYSTDSTTFNYEMDGKQYAYQSGIDLTSAFDIKLYDTYFTITFSEDITLQSIIESVNKGKKVFLPAEQNESGRYQFTLAVSSYNQSVVYRINFAFYQGVSGVGLPQGGIIL